jgi:hypothetical protein
VELVVRIVAGEKYADTRFRTPDRHGIRNRPEPIKAETGKVGDMKGKYYKPPAGRMTYRATRSAIRAIQRDLNITPSRLTQAQRYKLHCRVEELQKELRALEADRIKAEREKIKAEIAKLDMAESKEQSEETEEEPEADRPVSKHVFA